MCDKLIQIAAVCWIKPIQICLDLMSQAGLVCGRGGGGVMGGDKNDRVKA